MRDLEGQRSEAPVLSCPEYARERVPLRKLHRAVMLAASTRRESRERDLRVRAFRKRIPSDKRVLIFVQSPVSSRRLRKRSLARMVRFLEIEGSTAQKSGNLEKFQNNSEERVIMLNVKDESASSTNLTSANRAIFLSPLLTPTQGI
ncbi:hypothetical protein BJV78DRAFT_1282189 [Lactifluus subvellereus]|nr:hypothetical protein BJV78DRAFT_1282189 [Lactifluus subvellereus]